MNGKNSNACIERHTVNKEIGIGKKENMIRERGRGGG